nr:MAG TPA: hypothetical protein [Caudoviricetes sp.]
MRKCLEVCALYTYSLRIAVFFQRYTPAEKMNLNRYDGTTGVYKTVPD